MKWIAILLATTTFPLVAQWLNYPTTGVPRTPDGWTVRARICKGGWKKRRAGSAIERQASITFVKAGR
jgi:hypothetical protein